MVLVTLFLNRCFIILESNALSVKVLGLDENNASDGSRIQTVNCILGAAIEGHDQEMPEMLRNNR